MRWIGSVRQPAERAIGATVAQFVDDVQDPNGLSVAFHATAAESPSVLDAYRSLSTRSNAPTRSRNSPPKSLAFCRLAASTCSGFTCFPRSHEARRYLGCRN